MESIIICIGGTAGVGKSTVARAVATRLDFAHHLATGYLRETLRTILSPQEHPALFHATFRPHSAATLIDEFRAQAERVCHAVQACIQRSRAEGTNLVVEGNHLLPEYIHMLGYPTSIMLRATPAQIAERISGPTHRSRVITAQDYAHSVAIQDFIMREAIRWDIPIVDNSDRDHAATAILGIAGVDA